VHDPNSEDTGFISLTISAEDGLRLNARDYGSRAWASLPVVCLPGLARTAADFHELALALSGDAKRPRRVLALDYRGRGGSERDRNWHNYDIRVEVGDTIQVLTAAGIEQAVFVGTSRGGIITMGLSAARPTVVRGAVLNDIGPVIDGKGLIRIRGYVGKLPEPKDFRDGAQILRRLMDAQFPKLSEAEWETMARRTWTTEGDRLVAAYDTALTKTLTAIDLEAPLPPLWFLFAGLGRVPVMVLRGANSDILSPETVAAMQQRHSQLEAHVVADQGHAPLLSGKKLIQSIGRFVAALDHPAHGRSEAVDSKGEPAPPPSRPRKKPSPPHDGKPASSHGTTGSNASE
jgi:pimeloyl-ACP methyl ester carboxylesterase